MTGPDIAMVITSMATFVTALGGFFVSLRNSHKIEAVHEATNSKMDQLLTLTAKASKAEGIAQQRNNPT